MSGPRFEQTAMQFQPNPLSAMGMVKQDPIRLVTARRATCDGGQSGGGEAMGCGAAADAIRVQAVDRSDTPRCLSIW